MKCVILAGGIGSRLSEETVDRPKPLIEIGGKPILWHIMKIYSQHGINDFVVCLGYKGYMIKEYFANYFLHTSDVTFDLRSNNMEVHQRSAEPWQVTLVDTGDTTMTGGRLKRVSRYLDGRFCFTYGDGVSDVDIGGLVRFHQHKKTLATLTGVQPPGRFGALEIEDDLIRRFREKPQGDGGWINGGFMVCEPDVLDLIDGDHVAWEEEPLTTLAARGDLSVFRHAGFWQAMDTLRDKRQLEALWQEKRAPWATWLTQRPTDDAILLP